jgi:ABC-type branched-subunit amino acid transport system ATPase component
VSAGDLLSVTVLSKRFGGVAALSDCSLAIARGSVTAIIGPNGAGKSTLMNLIGGLFAPDAGRIVFDGLDITGEPPHRRARQGLIRTFQISRELGQLSVFENLMLAGQNEREESAWVSTFLRGAVARSERAVAERARALLERVGLFRLADEPASALSGGQKKLLELTRALMTGPKLVLLDEPAAGVSPPMVRELCDTIAALRAEGYSFGIVEHDMDLVAELADRVYVLAEGTTLTSGSYAEVTRDRRVVEAYLGGVA